MPRKYEIIIFWSDEDNAYVAEVPELAGCMADGSSYQEALAGAEIAIFVIRESRILTQNESITQVRSYGASVLIS